MQDQKFLVQCIWGHIHRLPDEHSLVPRCKLLVETGKLDAFSIPQEDCPQCLHEQISKLSESLEFHADWTPPEDGTLVDLSRHDLVALQERLDNMEPMLAVPN